MNKYQESIENLKGIQITEDSVLGDLRVCETIDDNLEPHEFNVKEAFECLQELVNKATPKKPVKDYSTKHPKIEFNWKCPTCNNRLLLWFDEEPNKSDEYCSCCGQHIDWSEDE